MKHLLILISFLLLSSPVFGQETGVLYHGKVNWIFWGWVKDGDEKKDGKYFGEIKNGKPNGRGTLSNPNGHKYEGEWKDGEYNGQGTYTYPDGENYVGEWKDGKKHGQGTYTWSDGNKYVGKWRDGERNGQGTFTSTDGFKYVGVWKNGKPWGDWEFVVKSVKGDKSYYDKDRLRKNGKFLYFWTLTDILKPFKGVLSKVGYVQLDCSIFRFKDLRIRTYNKSMGEGKITYVFTPKNEWRYPKPKSSGEVLYKEICEEHQ